ncbi:MAG: alpha/beta fold hydrolase [Planctomycetota bacterium]
MTLPGLSPQLYPFQGHYLELARGVRCHYLDEGSGPPVVMLHGNPSWSFYYRRLAALLRDRYRVVVPDHVGCGLSDKPDDDVYDYTLDRRVDDLEHLLDELRVEAGITLVLHDWGGMIGMAYAHRFPARIARLVILNTGAFPLPSGKRFPLTIALCRSPLGALLVRGLNLFCRGTASVGCRRRSMSADVRQGYLAPYDDWAHRIAIHRFVQDIPLTPKHRVHARVLEVAGGLEQFRDRPVQIFWGERDFVFDRHFLDEWMRRFPEAEVHRFADAGHYVLEDAFDEIGPRVLEFLARTDVAGR